jgi:hypothetical protein
MRQVHWVSQTSDAKTGKVVASYSPMDTCPDSCTFKEGGCYAWGLFYLKVLGKKIQNGTIKIKSLATALSERTHDCKVVRHRVAGDVVGDVIPTLEECSMVESHGLVNIGYTHAWKNDEAQPLKKWFRASCNTVEEVFEAHAKGWTTTLAVHGSNIPKKLKKMDLTFIKCPARHGVEGKKDITCNDCTLCKVSPTTQGTVVMFEVHGNHSTIKNATSKSANIGDILAI